MDDSHRHSLLDAFFHKKDEELVKKLKEQVSHDQQITALQDVSGIHDHDVLEHLVKVGLTRDSVAALSLAPLVQVAWADGYPDLNERNAVMKAVHESGVKEGTPGHQVIEEWLHHKPDAGLWNDWTVYAKALSEKLPTDAKTNLRTGLVERARRVAEASCGMIHFKLGISAAEQKVLDGIQDALN